MHSKRPLKLPLPQWTSSDGRRPRDGCHVRGDGGAISLTAKETSRESARADGNNPRVVGVWQQPHVPERAFPDVLETRLPLVFGSEYPGGNEDLVHPVDKFLVELLFRLFAQSDVALHKR